MTKKLLVVGAHSADYVWRAGGTIAKVAEANGFSVLYSIMNGTVTFTDLRSLDPSDD